MSGSYERTFTVSVPAARAFQAFTDPADLEIWFAERFDQGEGASEALSVGGPMHFEPIEVVPEKLLDYKQSNTTVTSMPASGVQAGGFAAEAGIEPGDILLQLGHGPVFDHPDIAFFVRDHEAADEVDVVFARAGEVCRGRAPLGPYEAPRWSLAS